jgi:ABC-type polysaccharide/polyol phosphate transport system ATPase subunit
MSLVSLRAVTVDLPVYTVSSRSLRKSLISLSATGRIMKGVQNHVTVRALDNVWLELNEGDRLGLVGFNGAGKSTLLRTIAGIYAPTIGEVHVNGAVSAVLDPSTGLDMEATGEENIRILARYRGIHIDVAEAAVAEIADFTELGHFLKLPVKTYSSGMTARLVFAVATAFDADIVVMDEWIGAGDASFVTKAQARIEAFVQRARLMVLASHSHDIIERFCNRVVLMEAGKVKMQGTAAEVFAAAKV